VNGADDGFRVSACWTDERLGPTVFGDVDGSMAGDAGGWEPDVAHGFEDAVDGGDEVAWGSGRGDGTEDVGEKVEAYVVERFEEGGRGDRFEVMPEGFRGAEGWSGVEADFDMGGTEGVESGLGGDGLLDVGVAAVDEVGGRVGPWRSSRRAWIFGGSSGSP
jgi:hypothetical protein